ncbi:MAG: lysophospholipid acyltransferase family protein [bacterium]|nr:lysophospholipid acyltransferase family protein [bacterium]
MKKIRYFLEYSIVYFIGLIVQMLPIKTAIFLGDSLGIFVYYCLPIRKKVAMNNLLIAFKNEKDPAEIKKICKGCYRNLGMSLIEFLRYPRYNKENLFKYIKIENEEYLKDSLAQGHGVIIIAGHFGNWEFSAAAVGLRGYPISQVSKNLHNYYLNNVVLKYRESKNINVIGVKMEVREIIHILKQNGIVGIADDQEARLHGLWVDFMGKEALTARGPVVFARKFGSPLIPCFIVRQSDKISHKMIFEKPITVGSLDDDKYLYQFNKLLEKYVRLYPEQYFWLHNRWRTGKTEGQQKKED